MTSPTKLEIGAEMVFPKDLFWGLVVRFTDEPTPEGLARGVAAATHACSEIGIGPSEFSQHPPFTITIPDGRVVLITPPRLDPVVVRVEDAS